MHNMSEGGQREIPSTDSGDSVIVVDKPRPRKKAAAVQKDDTAAPTLTAYCATCRTYTPLLEMKRTVVHGVVMTTGRCACGRGTFRVGGAKAESE